jgi:hypothetical protein
VAVVGIVFARAPQDVPFLDHLMAEVAVVVLLSVVVE